MDCGDIYFVAINFLKHGGNLNNSVYKIVSCEQRITKDILYNFPCICPALTLLH